MTTLYDVLKAGYSNDAKKQNQFAEKNGFIRDNELSNTKPGHGHQVYHNPITNQVIYNGNGTQTLGDWKNNALISVGLGDKTNRIKEEKLNIERARSKYKDAPITISGASQFGFIASKIAKPQDKVITFNRAYVGDNIKKNEQFYRTQQDPVSIFASGKKNVKTIPTKISANPTYPIHFVANTFNRLLDAHNIKNIKNKNILI